MVGVARQRLNTDGARVVEMDGPVEGVEDGDEVGE